MNMCTRRSEGRSLFIRLDYLSYLHFVRHGDRLAPLSGLEKACHQRRVVVNIRRYSPLLLHALQTEARTNKRVSHGTPFAWFVFL